MVWYRIHDAQNMYWYYVIDVANGISIMVVELE